MDGVWIRSMIHLSNNHLTRFR